MTQPDSPLDTIEITKTASAKFDRYLESQQLKDVLREETGYVCTKTSPNHNGLYDETKFVMRGEFAGHKLDIVFVVEKSRVIVVTQMAQHADSYRGRYYEHIGESVEDAVHDLYPPDDQDES